MQDTAVTWQQNMITSTEAMAQFVSNYGWEQLSKIV